MTIYVAFYKGFQHTAAQRRLTSTSDVILVYTYEGKLCYARQRDKFLQEFVIDNDPTKSLVWRVGTTKDGRFGIQWS